MSRKVRTLVIIGLSVLVGLSFILNTAIVAAKYYDGRILPNTIVSGMELGGKKLDEASSLITQQAEKITAQPITMQLNGSTATATTSELGVAINEGATLQSLSPTSDTWSWAKWHYWRDFFRPKKQTLVYAVDETKLTETLNKIFPVSQEAKDAAITVSNGQLETTLAEQGVTIDLTTLKKNLEGLVTNAVAPPPVTLDFTSSMPNVSDEEAASTKDEIIAALRPIYLTYNNTGYKIEVKDFFSYITFTKNGSQLDWQLTQSSLQELIKAKISKKIDLKMRQRTILSTTGQVTDEGQEGRAVDTSALAATLYQMTQNRQFNEAANPVAIPVNSLPITEKTITPAFVLGQYEGKYITIDLAHQKMYLLEGNNLVATYTVSSGKWSTPTPKGTYYVKNKISLAWSRAYNLYMPWWNALSANPDGSGYKGVGIHGLPCFNSSCTSREGESHIGTPVSHGCVRVDDAGAKFVYEWAPVGTPVVIN
jgi:lipoprotein-anchoring transpeptidase ErfK/SrfK